MRLMAAEAESLFARVVCIDSAQCIHLFTTHGVCFAGIFFFFFHYSVLANLARYEAVWAAVFARCI